MVAAAALVSPGTLAELHLPAAPLVALGLLLGSALAVEAMKLRNVNLDPLGERADRWERRLHGS